MPALMALAAQKGNRVDAMASVMALMTVAHGLGMLAGALLGGAMMDLFELRWVFAASAGIMLVGTAVFVLQATLVARRVVETAPRTASTISEAMDTAVAIDTAAARS
jgi:MFS family permease